MRRSLALSVVLVSVVAHGAEPVPAEKTQAGMEETAAHRLADANDEMTRLLAVLTQGAIAKPDAIAKLKSAQSAWEAYRDSQVGALWPGADQSRYGSAVPMCVASVKRRLTEARVRELEAMLRPPEGDACASQWPD